MTIACVDCGALAGDVAEGAAWRCYACPSAVYRRLPTPTAPAPKVKRVRRVVRPEPKKSLPMGSLQTDDVVPRLDMNPKGWGECLPQGVLVILSADPGGGKSTFTLLSAGSVKGVVLYAATEESVHQIAARGKRIGANPAINLYHCNSMFGIVEEAKRVDPDLLVVDSLNDCTGIESGGENSALVDKLATLRDYCHTSGTTAIVIAHVNAEGEISGPTTLEHRSDINVSIKVCDNEDRIIRGSKNRFGRTGVYAAYRMADSGIVWIADPEEPALTGKRKGRKVSESVAGS